LLVLFSSAACGRTGLGVDDVEGEAGVPHVDATIDTDAIEGPFDAARDTTSEMASDAASDAIDATLEDAPRRSDGDARHDTTIDAHPDSVLDTRDSTIDVVDETIFDADADVSIDGAVCDAACPISCVLGTCITVKAIALGGSHTCALMSDDSLRCWGANDYGQLGDGTSKNRPTPETIAALATSATAPALDDGYTCTVMTDGSGRCWGWNSVGELGDGTLTDRHVPTIITALGSSVQQIAVGGDHTCALMVDGSVRCWGSNANGQLGDGGTIDQSSPVSVAGLGIDIQHLALGTNHTCALATDGSVLCWGRNHHGQIGDGTTTDRHLPTTIAALGSDVAQIAAGGDHTCARMNDGSVRCWGSGAYGELGDGVAIDRATPEPIVALGTSVSSISLGGFHTCARMTDGSARCWGANGAGQIGDGTTTDRWTPETITALGSGVRDIALGEFHTCAVLTDGSASCWGLNASNQLGGAHCTIGYFLDACASPVAPEW
jgi:alpha-tubulin suppressor-like RCC1 family protein